MAIDEQMHSVNIFGFYTKSKWWFDVLLKIVCLATCTGTDDDMCFRCIMITDILTSTTHHHLLTPTSTFTTHHHLAEHQTNFLSPQIIKTTPPSSPPCNINKDKCMRLISKFFVRVEIHIFIHWFVHRFITTNLTRPQDLMELRMTWWNGPLYV